MKAKSDFDPDWMPSSPRRLWPIGSIWQLMVVVAVSGAIFAVSVTLTRQPLSSIVYVHPALAPAGAASPQLVFYPAVDDSSGALVTACPINGQKPPATPDQPFPPIAITTAESIDPKMVVRAPEWIDPKMVVVAPGEASQPEQGGLRYLVPEQAVTGIGPGTGSQFEVVPVPQGSAPPAKRLRPRLAPPPGGSKPPAKDPHKR
jgi:hypothetical protein